MLKWSDISLAFMSLLCVFYVVCQKSSVNDTRKQTKQKIQINFIGLQNNRLRAPDQGSMVDFFMFPRLK
jgi:hypothetical protein